MTLPEEPKELTPFRDSEVLALFTMSAPNQTVRALRRRMDELKERFAAAGVEVADPAFRKDPMVIRIDEKTVYVAQAVILRERSADGVLAAVERLNRAARSLDNAGLRFISAGPMWLVGAGQGWEDGGGPGGRPQPGSPRYFRPGKSATSDGDPSPVQEEYRRIMGSAAPDTMSGKGVRVAILDTWPMGKNPKTGNEDHVGRIATFCADHGVTAAQHPLLLRAANGKLVDHFKDMDPDPSIPHHQVNWETDDLEPRYEKSDHGLFVAGIIRDIAPKTEITVYRVLNDQGGGDVLDVFAALAEITGVVQAARQRKRTVRYVVNLSFGFLAPLRMIPILVEHPHMSRAQQVQAFKATTNPGSPNLDLESLEKTGLISLAHTPGGICKVGQWQTELGPLAQGIQQMATLFNALAQVPEILLVAAAGNDSDRSQNLVFPPRLPAIFEGVLGVSSTQAPGAFSTFSNRDDLDAERDDGVAARGGERVHNAHAGMYDTRSGVMGLAVAPSLPPAPDGIATQPNNTTGWAQWAGTSFAAPIVVGMAVCMWEADPGLSGDQLINKLIAPVIGPRNEIVLSQS